MRQVPGARGARLVRRGVAGALGTYGRVVVTVAERITPGPAKPAGTPRAPKPVRAVKPAKGTRPIDARKAELGELRRIALESTLGAAADPSTSAYDRLSVRTDSLSEWAAGRLLGEAEKMRQAGIAALSAGTGDGRLLPRRQFDAALRRQFPWLDDDSSSRIYDHAVLVNRHITVATAAAEEPADGPVKRAGAVLGRLRRRR